MLNVKVNWFFLKISIIVMQKRGVLSCHESENQRNKKFIGRVSLFAQHFEKPRISDRLNHDPAIQIASPKVTQVLLRFCRNGF